jgi:hypothetical protein
MLEQNMVQTYMSTISTEGHLVDEQRAVVGPGQTVAVEHTDSGMSNV